VIGLAEAGREDGRVFLANESGQVSIILEAGLQSGMASIAFDVAPEVDLAALAHALHATGIEAERVTNSAPGCPAAVRFRDPEGRMIELHTHVHFHDNRQPLPGVVPLKLGHVACYTADPAAAAPFYQETLGFRVSDWIEDRFVFLRCSHEHHTVNFTRGPDARMHHLAFALRDAAHMHRACDILGGQKVSILWGPVRHGPGHNVAMYHRDPDGNAAGLLGSSSLAPGPAPAPQSLGGSTARHLGPATLSGLPRDAPPTASRGPHLSLGCGGSGSAKETRVTEQSITPILAQEDRRFRAMIENDQATLDQLIAEDLHFVHSNGLVEGKAEFLRKLSTGERRYVRYEAVRRDVRREGGFTFVFGEADAEIGRAAGNLVTKMTYTAVYRDLPEPRLFAWHSVKSAG
jgi:catechol 2,3-dioxygenase-like lactoylglutathione lyase family enzyme